MLDVKALIGEVAARNGVRLEADDPAFALVTLNELVLEQVVNNLIRQVQAAAAEFELSVQKLQNRTGVVLAQELRRSIAAFRAELPAEPRSSRHDGTSLRWVCIGAGGGAGLFALGIAVGLMF